MNVYNQSKKILDDICLFLDKSKYKHERIDDITIRVFNSDSVVEYHAWDMYLIKFCAAALGSTLDYGFKTEVNGSKRFTVSTKATFDLGAYITRTNKILQLSKNPEVLGIFISENLDKSSSREVSICTMYYNGTWVRAEYNKSELLYCSIKDYIPEMQPDGSYLYSELMQLYNDFKEQK